MKKKRRNVIKSKLPNALGATFVTMHLFITESLHWPETQLSKEESHHATRVLRIKTGDEVCVTDGKGSLYKGCISHVDSKSTTVVLNPEPFKTVSLHEKITMAVAPLKSNDRFEWFLEKATELGVYRIVPLICEHSERVKFNPERWHRVVMAAVKQSMNPLIPEIETPVKFNDFIKTNTLKTYLAHCAEGNKEYLGKAVGTDDEICICIGPEGDFSLKEIEAGIQSGYIPVSLGDLRLRTETAALASLIIAQNEIHKSG